MKLEDIADIGTGAVHAVVLRPVVPLVQREELDVYTLVHRNVISVLYQIPQYVVLTVGEILFAITGIGFAYSQAPESMKSVIQAALLLTTAVGNLIDVVVTGIHFLNQVAEFFLFAVLMVMATLVFGAMAYNYSDLADDSSQRMGNNSFSLLAQVTSGSRLEFTDQGHRPIENLFGIENNHRKKSKTV